MFLHPTAIKNGKVSGLLVLLASWSFWYKNSAIDTVMLEKVVALDWACSNCICKIHLIITFCKFIVSKSAVFSVVC